MWRVVTADFILAIDDIPVGHVGILYHIVHDHISRRPAGSGFAMEMEPGIVWQSADENQEGVDFARRRPEMVRIGQADVVDALAFCQFLFRLDASYGHNLRMNGQIAFPLVVDRDVCPQNGLQALLFIDENLGLGLSYISPIVTAIPADGRAVEEAV